MPECNDASVDDQLELSELEWRARSSANPLVLTLWRYANVLTCGHCWGTIFSIHELLSSHHRLRSNVGRNMLQIQQIWLRIWPVSVVLCSYGSYGPCLSMLRKDLLIAALGCCRNLRKLYLLQRRSSSVFDWTLWFAEAEAWHVSLMW